MSAVEPEGPPRVVHVTGASSGIGRATAQGLARRGDELVLTARSRGPLEDVARECREAGAAGVHVAPADVSDSEAVDAVVDAILARHGRLDVVVHSAAVVAYGALPDVPVEVWDRAMRTNLLGAANVARSVVPVLRRQQQGHLVLLGSLLGQIGVPGMSAYTVGKWGVRALARTLQLENRDVPGVHVTLVVPGGVDTPVYHAAATYLGHVGRPPPPVASPEHVADRVVAALDRPRARVSVGPVNPLMTAGFVLLPRVYDALVGPLFARLALEPEAVADGTGNVLAPQDGDHRLRGTAGSGVRAVLASAAAAVRPRR